MREGCASPPARSVKRVCIEGPERLNNDSLKAIIDNWKEQKTRRLHVWQYLGGEIGPLGGEVELFGGKLPLRPPPLR